MIEKGTMADIDELERLYNALNDHLVLHTNYPGWKKGVYPIRETAETGISEGCLYVLRTDGHIAATVILRHYGESAYATANWGLRLDDRDVWVVNTLAVHPLYLGKGLGNMLMDFILEHGVQTNAKAIRLDVYEKNAIAISLYNKYGFQYIDTVDLGYGEHGLKWFGLYQKIL